MTAIPLLTPDQCMLFMVDHQAGLAFAVESMDRQTLRSNAVAIARTAGVFSVPVVASTSATKAYSGPMIPEIQAALPSTTPIERHNMNAWEDTAVKAAIEATGRRKILISGLLTEACVSFPALSLLAEGYEVYVVADACGGLTELGHRYALERIQAAGGTLVPWLQILLEFQREWSRHETYEGARSVVVDHAGGYGIGLNYARAVSPPY
jgi:nicotinamidase-related amidase